jgi:hypothetical protein
MATATSCNNSAHSTNSSADTITTMLQGWAQRANGVGSVLLQPIQTAAGGEHPQRRLWYFSLPRVGPPPQTPTPNCTVGPNWVISNIKPFFGGGGLSFAFYSGCVSTSYQPLCCFWWFRGSVLIPFRGAGPQRRPRMQGISGCHLAGGDSRCVLVWSDLGL